MAFVQVNKGPRGRLTASAAGISSLRMSVRPKSTGKSASVYIFPSVALVEETLGVKIDGGKVYQSVANLSIQEGVGDDAGYWLLVDDPNGYAVTLSRRGAQTLTMTVVSNKLKHYVLDGLDHDPVDLEFAVDTERKEILFQVPEWIKFDPHSVYSTVQSIKPPESPANRLNRQQRRRLNKLAVR